MATQAAALQDFAWSESGHERKRAALRGQAALCPQLRDEPLFCFETAVKLFYWSTLVRRLAVIDVLKHGDQAHMRHM